MNTTMTPQPKLELPSKVLWKDPPAGRIALLAIGVAMVCIGLVMTVRIMCKLYKSGSKAVQNQAGARFTPLKVQQQIWILTLNVVMLLSGLIKLTLPELALATNLVEVIYKVTAFNALYLFIVTQFGGVANLCRDDFTGTLQHHKEYKIWKAPPLCCCWVFCLPLMKPKKITWRDIQIIAFFVTQFLVLGPLLAALMMAVNIFGWNTAEKVMNFANTFSLLSLLVCMYAMNVLIGVAEACSHVSQQRPGLTAPAVNEQSDGPTQESAGESDSQSKPKKNLGPKIFWIIYITGFPALCTALLPLFVTSDYYVEAGGVLLKQFMELHWSGFINIFFAFFGSLWASRAFPSDDNLLIPLEWFSARILEAELVPAFVLNHLGQAYAKVVDDRRSKGMDINLGVDPGSYKPILSTVELNMA